MIKYTLYLLIFFFSCVINLTYGQEEVELDEIIVTAGRIPLKVTELSKNVFVINEKELKELPAVTLSDIINFLPGSDLKQRGAMGGQADFSVRGGSFEQSLIMLDGIKLSDPQTGHHNLNIPVIPDDIERIELLKGEASKSFGPNAFSGVLNIITKKNTDDRLYFQIVGGENGLLHSSFNAGYSVLSVYNKLSFSREVSDGYRLNTGYKRNTFNYTSSYKSEKSNILFFFGYLDNDFGANSFYSAKYPLQAEKIITKLFSLSGDIYFNNFIISSKSYLRNNSDEFVLNKENPAFYKNIHNSDSYGSEIQISLNSAFGTFSSGVEVTKDEIVSSNLGTHTRNKYGIFFEYAQRFLEKIFINAGGFAYRYSGPGWKVFPGIDISYNPFDIIKLYFTFGKAFRIPTYTELYYNDPVTSGNPNLQPEESLNYEFGTKFLSGTIGSTISVFYKSGKNLIDWVRENKDSKWLVQNIASVNTLGVDLDININLQPLGIKQLKNISLNYTYIYSDKSIISPFESRYLLEHLKHQVSANLSFIYFLDISHSLILRYEERFNQKRQFLVDTKFKKEIGALQVFLKINNVLNHSYSDFADIPLPGRWFTGGLSYNFTL